MTRGDAASSMPSNVHTNASEADAIVTPMHSDLSPGAVDSTATTDVVAAAEADGSAIAMTPVPPADSTHADEVSESRPPTNDEYNSDQTEVILRLERRLESVMAALDKLSSEKEAAARGALDQSAAVPSARPPAGERGAARGSPGQAGPASHRVTFVQDYASGDGALLDGGQSSPAERSRFESIDEIALDQIRSVVPPVKVQHGPRFGSPRILSSEDSNDANAKHVLKYNDRHDENGGADSLHGSHELAHNSYPMDHGRSSGSPGATASSAANYNNHYNSNTAVAAGGSRASDELAAALKLFVDALSRNQAAGGASSAGLAGGHPSSGGGGVGVGSDALTDAAGHMDPEVRIIIIIAFHINMYICMHFEMCIYQYPYHLISNNECACFSFLLIWILFSTSPYAARPCSSSPTACAWSWGQVAAREPLLDLAARAIECLRMPPTPRALGCLWGICKGTPVSRTLRSYTPTQICTRCRCNHRMGHITTWGRRI
jgi:hypothetical protein